MDSMHIFVTSPIGNTHTIRNLSLDENLHEFTAKLEFATGFPSGTYTLKYGQKTISDTSQFLFRNDLQNCAVLRMSGKTQLDRVLASIKATDVDSVCQECTDTSEKGNMVTSKMDTSKGFIAACISANLGLQTIVCQLLGKDSGILSARTINGRNIAHILTASDQPQILFDVLILSAKHEIDLLVEDNLKNTPTDIALQNGAIICERMIREYIRRKRSGTLRMDLLNDIPQQTNLKKPRSKSALPHYTKTKSVSSIDSFAKISRTNEAASSGYHTQEDIPETCTAEVNKLHLSNTYISESPQVEPGEEKRSSSPKRVKFVKRIKSAPANQQKHQSMAFAKDSIQSKHMKCHTTKPFMAYRNVPEEELRPLAVEYVALPKTNTIGLDQKTHEKQVSGLLHDRSASPVSSLGNSIQDITDLDSGQSPSQREVSTEMQYSWRQSKVAPTSQEDDNRKVLEKKRDVCKRYTNPKTTTKRVQSSKYYKASYHIRKELELYYETIPPPKPATANSRYRAWKPWLLDKYQDMEDQAEREQSSEYIDNKLQNAQAYRKWQQKKCEEGTLDGPINLSSEDEEDPDCHAAAWTENYYAAFQPYEEFTYEKWHQQKAKLFKTMDEKTLRHKRGEKYGTPKHLLDRRVTAFEIGSTDPTPMKIDHPDSYMHAFQKWKRRKSQYEIWKDRHGLPREDTSQHTPRDMRDMRRAMYLDGFAYNQWLGQLDREDKMAKHQRTRKVQFSLKTS